jgi:hypothetical protein
MKQLLFCFFVITSFGCVQKNKIPGDVLPQNKMRSIMWDLMVADAYISEYIQKDSTKNAPAESLRLYEQVFRLHATDKEAFKKSLVFYQSRPDLLKVITDSLRNDEKRVMERQYGGSKPKPDSTVKKPGPDTSLIKIKPSKLPGG